MRIAFKCMAYGITVAHRVGMPLWAGQMLLCGSPAQTHACPCRCMTARGRLGRSYPPPFKACLKMLAGLAVNDIEQRCVAGYMLASTSCMVARWRLASAGVWCRRWWQVSLKLGVMGACCRLGGADVLCVGMALSARSPRSSLRRARSTYCAGGLKPRCIMAGQGRAA